METTFMLAMIADINVIAKQTRDIMQSYEMTLKKLYKKMHKREVVQSGFMALLTGTSNDFFDPNVSGKSISNYW